MTSTNEDVEGVVTSTDDFASQDFAYDEGDAMQEGPSSNFKVVIRVRPPVDREMHGYRYAYRRKILNETFF